MVQSFTLLSFHSDTLVVGFNLNNRWIFAPPILVTVILNWYRYEHKVDLAVFKFERDNEDKSKSRLSVISLSLPGYLFQWKSGSGSIHVKLPWYL